MSIDKELQAAIDELHVYTLHDDPDRILDNEERWWDAIAAETEQEALAIAAAMYGGDGPRNERAWKESFVVARKIDTSNWPERLRPRYPQRLADCEALRLCGFAECGETRCDSCDLAPMGMAQYKVCEGCYRCPECGCTCDERNLAEESQEAKTP